VDLAHDGQEGQNTAFINQYDLIILDLNLPVTNGINVCKNIRDAGNEAAILILTARDSVNDKTLGLDTGADDYMTKPFSFDELRARVHALIRRSMGRRNPAISIGPLVIEPAKRTARVNCSELSLTPKEFDILEYLASKSPELVSSEDLIEHVWNETANPFSNTLKVHIANIKRKLKEQTNEIVIEANIGKGYGLRRV
jgi:DNA-binding response OmpR family regulator